VPSSKCCHASDGREVLPSKPDAAGVITFPKRTAFCGLRGFFGATPRVGIEVSSLWQHNQNTTEDFERLLNSAEGYIAWREPYQNLATHDAKGRNTRLPD
jgi:hypothetical protein